MSELSFWVDESEKGNMLAVGGIIVPVDEIPSIVKEWRSMKEKIGLEPYAEIKWTLPPDHPTRSALGHKGLKPKYLLEKAIDFIASQLAVKCAVAVMWDIRNLDKWKQQRKDASVRDFYCAGLKMALQRVAEECAEDNKKLCLVVCDEPGLGKTSFSNRSIKRGSQALEESFKEWYENGVGLGPGGQHHFGSLRELFFQPSPWRAHAKFHDMLQIADVIVGITRDWVAKIKQGKTDPWVINQIKKIQKKFRQKYGKPSLWGDGLILWPYDLNLWNKLKRSLI